jgi:DNA-binding NtrC family response regulator
LGSVIDALVSALRQERFDQLREQFERAAATALDLERVTFARRALMAGGADLVCERGGWKVPVPGTAAVLECDTGVPRARRDRPDHDAHALGSLAALALELERMLAGPLPPRRTPAPILVGQSPAMEAVRQVIGQVCRTAFPVLIEGESGAGKEVVARAIHSAGRRGRGPFVAVNCAAIVDSLLEAELFGIEDRTATGVRGRRGKFELAGGGTLFLDEIADLSSAAQAKLLRVLQDFTIERVGGHVPIPIDVRVIAATNRPLAALVSQGRFRADLFYRLNGVEVRVPPLRERRGDVPALVAHILSRHREYGKAHLSRDAMAALQVHSWPGNVRELERVIERAIALCGDADIGLEHLPAEIAAPFREVFEGPLGDGTSLRRFAGHYARLMVERCGNNKREACRALGITYHTLEAYLRRSDGSGPRATGSRAPCDQGDGRPASGEGA